MFEGDLAGYTVAIVVLLPAADGLLMADGITILTFSSLDP